MAVKRPTRITKGSMILFISRNATSHFNLSDSPFYTCMPTNIAHAHTSINDPTTIHDENY